ncbi:MAG: pyruvate dehydrogenase complex dihydrolipoamide acetyltransferase [Parachlamydiaceae bacterium]|nr:pyruvate dehydrogenase complex dihydrolipoamide acetyltransferase [Parachlamydiaceae bacterium]
MPFTFTMPKLSPTMEVGTLVKWHKKVGEYVNAGDPIVEIATDKATVEHEVLDAGWLRLILLEEGKEAHVNAPLAVLSEEQNESIEGYVPEGTISGATATVVADNAAATPASTTPPSPEAEPKPVPSTPAPIATAPAVAPDTNKTEKQSTNSTSQPASAGRIFASPLAKKLAQDQGIELARVKGTGPGGRIMKKDLSQASSNKFPKQHTPKLAAGTHEEVTLTPIRKIIAQRLQEAKSTIPHFYVRQAVDVEPLIALRSQLKNYELDLTFNDLIIKAIALTLKDHPDVNCGFDATKKVLLSYKTIDISIAVSIEGGLITPIITHADIKSLEEISAEVKSLAKRAKEGKLEPHEYQGGSFTLSNMGMYGITDFQAIINPPQAAILAVSGITDTPVVKNGQVVAGKLLNITLSVDHRAIDGVAASRFIKALQRRIENPASLLL